jgi:carboxypeptidase C (cathepsin A)
MYENGPCHVMPGLKAVKNPFSWTNHANVIWLDQPAGTGFSYLLYEKDHLKDTIKASKDVLTFLKRWFKNHKQFQKNDFFIFGQGFTAHFVLGTGHAIQGHNMESREKINFKGVGLGNGLVSPGLQMETYVHYLKDNPYNITDFVTRYQMNEIAGGEVACKKFIELCDRQPKECKTAKQACEMTYLVPPFHNSKNLLDIRTKECKSQPYCYDFDPVTRFMQLKSTRKSLQVRRESAKWYPSNEKVHAAFSHEYTKDMSQFVAVLLSNKIRVLVYAGDADYTFNWLGCKKWTKKMEWHGSSHYDRDEDTVWLDPETKLDAGEWRSAHGLSFVRIYGAGRMTSLDKPRATAAMLKTWLSNGKFTESDSTLLEAREALLHEYQVVKGPHNENAGGSGDSPFCRGWCFGPKTHLRGGDRDSDTKDSLTKDADKDDQRPEGDCNDGTKNGFETDADCGGFECDKCHIGHSCRDGQTDCTSGVCEDRKCKAEQLGK